MADVKTLAEAQTNAVVELLGRRDLLAGHIEPKDFLGRRYTMQLRIFNGREFVTVRINAHLEDSPIDLANAVAQQFAEYTRKKRDASNARRKSKG